MKKTLALLFACTMAVIVSCAKSNPEAEAKALMLDMTKLTVATTEKITKAASGKEAGDALLVYVEGMKKFSEKGKEFDKKYPDLKLEKSDKLKIEQEAFMKALIGFTTAVDGTMKKFADSKEFKDAMDKLKTMGK